MRLFVAVRLPATVVEALSTWCQRMAVQLSQTAVVWTRPENIHLTVRFVGAVTPGQARSLRDVLDAVAVSQAPFDLQLDTCGVFPDSGPPRVLWLGLLDDDGRRRLEVLQGQLEARIQGLGFAAEVRAYRPHITLARLRRGNNVDATGWRGQQPSAAAIPVNALHLVQSSSKSAGPVYTTLHRSIF